MLNSYPDFKEETVLHSKGYRIIAGIDEVGRGCFAGPVVTGCVVFPNDFWVLPRTNPKSTHKGSPALGLPVARHSKTLSVNINDSKKMTPKQREIADKWIRKNAMAVGIGVASVREINKVGIKKATEMAFRRAIKNAGVKIDYLLIDAFYIPHVRGLRRKNQKAIIKGDGKSVSIAAASIVAKVYRDKLMESLSQKRKYRKYKWHMNKGYGTLSHRELILKYGTSVYHRTQFIATWRSKI